MSARKSSPSTFGWIMLGLVGITLVCFLALQLIPVPRDNPPVIKEPTWDSPQTRALAKRACFDCHSNETVWPWYSYIAPMSWIVSRNVMEGRNRLNFSEWGVPRGGESGEFGEGGGFGEGGEGGGEVGEAILSGRMPPANYLPTHPQAVLTDAEKQALIDGLTKSMGQ